MEMQSIASRLMNHINTLAPVEGVTVRDINDKSTWEVDYLPGATPKQKKDVRDFIAAVDPVAAMVVTDEERVEREFSQSDFAVVIFEALFVLSNDVRELQGQTPLTRPQLKSLLKDKLPPAADAQP
jgi:hypothetical protein